MIDFHSHILPNIDDGSISMEETLNLMQEARDVGFTKIISTSHYIEDYYDSDEAERKELLNKIIEKTEPTPNCKDEKNRTDPKLHEIELYLGNEIYITNEMIQLLKDKKASTINNSKYVLFELPMNSKPFNAKETVYRLIENGYTPVIAHPERYSYVQDDIQYVKELADMGALLQSNYGSIIGLYGKKPEKTVKKLLKEDLIHFLGSDVHRTNQIYPKIPKIIKKLNKIISEEKIEELTEINPQKVLNNEEIE